MKIEVRTVNGSVRLDLVAETERERQGLQLFVETTNGGPFKNGVVPRCLDIFLRIESVGFDMDDIESIALVETECFA